MRHLYFISCFILVACAPYVPITLTMQTFFAVLAVGLMVYDQANDNKDNQKRYLSKTEVYNSIKRDALVTSGIVASLLADRAVAKAAEDEQYLPYELFNDEPINSQTKKRGKLFFPMENALRFVRLVIPVAGKQYVFDFKRRGVTSVK